MPTLSCQYSPEYFRVLLRYRSESLICEDIIFRCNRLDGCISRNRIFTDLLTYSLTALSSLQGILAEMDGLGKGKKGKRDNGTMGQWDNGTMGQWDNGTMGQWDNGTMGQWTMGQLDQGTLGQCT